jgi:tetratricopeptide (TPR) repeat protein
MLSKKTLLARAAMAAATLAVFSMPKPADAAVTVFGSGYAELCYEGAENGGIAADYITYCTLALNTALSIHDRAASYINRGVLRLSLNETNAALTDFESGLAIGPDLSEGYVDRGAALIEKKQYAEAVTSINRGLELGARRPALAFYDRAIANEGLGDIPAAYKDYQQALVVQPDFSLASDELKRFKVVRKTTGS